MKKLLKLKSLPLEIPYNPKVRISYNENYEKKGENGACIFKNKNEILHITICSSNYYYLERMSLYTEKFLDMLYCSILIHEEVHALQFSGNFLKIHSLAEKVLGRKFPSRLIKRWDINWSPNEKQLVKGDKSICNLTEDWAQIGEIIGLKLKGYSKRDINNFMFEEYREFIPDVSDDFFFKNNYKF